MIGADELDARQQIISEESPHIKKWAAGQVEWDAAMEKRIDKLERVTGTVPPPVDPPDPIDPPVEPPVIPPPPGTVGLASFEVTLTPNYIQADDSDASNYQSTWVIGQSPTTPWRGPDSQRQVARYLLLDPSMKDSGGRAGKDEWWFIIEKNWPSSFDPINHGSWGRESNWHGVGGDDGGINWSWEPGDSALALDFFGDLRPRFHIESNGSGGNGGQKDFWLPAPTRDVWNTYVVHWIGGRIDTSECRPGLFECWVNGDRIHSAKGLNTIYRLKDPSGTMRRQRWMQIWEGDYTKKLPKNATHQFSLMRCGNTFAEAKADRPRRLRDTNSGSRWTGATPNNGPPKLRVLPDRDPALSRLPKL